jgi:acetate kinase
MEDTLMRGSGLLGVSGISGDMRKILAAAKEGHAGAKLAYERFILYARRGVGAMSGALGGTDMLVFTGGVGEHEPRIRSEIAAALGPDLIDVRANETGEEGLISRKNSPVQVVLTRAREELILLREVMALLG